jgi:hypothetical protein
MNATTDDRDEPIEETVPAVNAELVSMPRCKRCNLLYMGTKSTSALRLTYCSFLCELGDLGFSMQGLEYMERAPKESVDLDVEPEPEPVGSGTAAII